MKNIQVESVALGRLKTSRYFRLRDAVERQYSREGEASGITWNDDAHTERLKVSLGEGHNARPFREPLLVWNDPEDTGEKLTVLDGVHRLAAYKAAKWKGPVPVKVFVGDRRAALQASVAARAVVLKAASAAERANMAWRMVREPVKPRYKVREVVEASGIAERTVYRMRRQLEVLMGDSEAEITGNWRRDQGRTWAEEDNDEEGTEAWKAKMRELDAEEKRLVVEFRNLMDRRQRTDMKLLRDKQRVGEAFITAYGQRHFDDLLEWLGWQYVGPPADDFSPDWMPGDDEGT